MIYPKNDAGRANKRGGDARSALNMSERRRSVAAADPMESEAELANSGHCVNLGGKAREVRVGGRGREAGPKRGERREEREKE